MKRKFTFDDALAAAEALREISAGHEEAAVAVLNAAGLDALSNAELEALCEQFGVEALARRNWASRSRILEHMTDKRPAADRILVAQLTGTARHHARWRELTGAEEAAAVAALRELAAGRADLLAEVAGILEGASEGELDEPLGRQAADLCRKAGADLEAIPAWIEEGRRRRAAASMPPFSGGLHGGMARRSRP
jgi:hypothetical protein